MQESCCYFNSLRMLFLSILTGFQKLLPIFFNSICIWVCVSVCRCVHVYVCMCPQKPEEMNIPGTWVKSSLRAHPTWLLWIELRSSAEVIHGLTAKPCPLEYFYDVYYGMSLGWRLMQGPLCSPGTASQVWVVGVHHHIWLRAPMFLEVEDY